ncbi:MAG: hypothetical protein ACHQQS_12625 [Thermoanaerobaculales bacterium]
MSFEKFVPPRKQKPPQVSIKRTGTITFDNSIAGVYGLGKAAHVILYFDSGKKLVGVKPAHDGREEGAMKLSHRKRVSSVRARAFFDTYGIRLDRTSRCAVAQEKEDGMVVIDLGEVKRRRGPRKRRP